MSDIKLFSIENGLTTELDSRSFSLEKKLQVLMEQNLETLLGVRFLATEFTTGKNHKGRIDTLGIDENGCPVIIEYKRSVNENVINQGLFYLDWLMDHKADFTLLVLEKLGKKVADSIEWTQPRLLCIASDFTRYDEHAVQQINRNIELIRYRRFGDEPLLLELVNATQGTPSNHVEKEVSGKGKTQYKTVGEYLEDASTELKQRFDDLKDFLLSLGDDVQIKELKYYFAFKRIKNFSCVEVHPKTNTLALYLKLNPDKLDLDALGDDFAQDVRNVGHWGTGDLRLYLRSSDDLEKSKPLIMRSYENS